MVERFSRCANARIAVWTQRPCARSSPAYSTLNSAIDQLGSVRVFVFRMMT